LPAEPPAPPLDAPPEPAAAEPEPVVPLEALALGPELAVVEPAPPPEPVALVPLLDDDPPWHTPTVPSCVLQVCPAGQFEVPVTTRHPAMQKPVATWSVSQ
jgi:hypothetical protein